MKSIFSLYSLCATILLFALFIPSDSGCSYPPDDKDQAQIIKQVIEKAYIQGIHKKQNKDIAEMGFHPKFNMLVLKNNKLVKVDLDQWFRMMGGSRNSKNDKPGPTISHTFCFVDVTGSTAVAKLKVYKDEKLFATDYMSLYKFNDQWKIVSKVFTFDH